MIVMDALYRMDEILGVEPLKEAECPKHPKDAGIILENVKFSYADSKANAVDSISLSINPGEHVALVGPSGGGKTKNFNCQGIS